MNTNKRRELERVQVLVEADYRDEGRAVELSEAAVLLDINHRGCRIMSRENIERGKVIAIDLLLPAAGASQKLSMSAVTAWSRETPVIRAYETGVRFITDHPGSEDDTNTLLKFCHHADPGYQDTPGAL